MDGETWADTENFIRRSEIPTHTRRLILKLVLKEYEWREMCIAIQSTNRRHTNQTNFVRSSGEYRQLGRFLLRE